MLTNQYGVDHNKATMFKVKSQKDDISRVAKTLANINGKILQFGRMNRLNKIINLNFENENQYLAFNQRLIIVLQSQNNFKIRNTKQPCRILYAKYQWPDILSYSADPALEIIIVNTTLKNKISFRENIIQIPPHSQYGKLIAFLFNRYKFFQGDLSKGLTIFIKDEEMQSPSIVEATILEVAHLNKIDPGFLDWVEKGIKLYPLNYNTK